MTDYRTRSKSDSELAAFALTEDRYFVETINGEYVQKCASTLKTGGSLVRVKTSQTMNDVVTPHYRRRIRNGDIINSPMSIVKNLDATSVASVTGDRTTEVEYGGYGMNFPPWHVAGTLFDVGYKVSGSVPANYILGTTASHLSPSSIDVAALRDLAVTSAHANVDRSEAQALMMIAEGEKTVQSLASIFKRAVRLFRIYNKISRMRYLTQRDKKFLKDNLSPKEIANRYMEVRYSLRPLLYDAKQCIDALQPKKHFNRFTYRGYAEATSEKTSVLPEYAFSTAWTRVIPQKHTIRSVNVRAGVLTAIDSESVLNRWGFDQPIETLWEIIPLSFVADWFFNIGQTIASHTPEIGTRELASWVVISDKLSTTLSAKSSRAYYSNQKGISISNCFMEKKTETVTRLVDPPKAWMPRCKIRLNALKLLDLGIILKNLSPNDGGIKNLTRKMY